MRHHDRMSTLNLDQKGHSRNTSSINRELSKFSNSLIVIDV